MPLNNGKLDDKPLDYPIRGFGEAPAPASSLKFSWWHALWCSDVSQSKRPQWTPVLNSPCIYYHYDIYIYYIIYTLSARPHLISQLRSQFQSIWHHLTSGILPAFLGFHIARSENVTTPSPRREHFPPAPLIQRFWRFMGVEGGIPTSGWQAGLWTCLPNGFEKLRSSESLW